MLLPQHAHFSHVSGAQNIKILQNVKSLRMLFTSTRIFYFCQKKLTFDSVALGEINYILLPVRITILTYSKLIRIRLL